MKFAFIAKHRAIWPVSWLCKAQDVSTSGFHDWLNRKPAKRTLENETSNIGISIRTLYLLVNPIVYGRSAQAKAPASAYENRPCER